MPGAALLVLAVLAVYAPVERHEFVHYDDQDYVVDNPMVTGGLTRDGIARAFTGSHASNWHPLTWLSHMLDYEWYGADPAGHHRSSVVLHALNAALLFWALAAMTGRLGRSWVVAAMFALHPLRVESVAWVAERKDVLSGLLFMIALLLYARYARRPGPAGYVLVALTLALGLMAKPMLVTLPLVLLLLDVWPLRRVDPRRDRGEGWRRTRALVLEKVPLLALAAGGALLTWLAQRSGGAVESLEALGLPVRAANALLGYTGYLWKTVWPVGLAFFYPHPALVSRDLARDLFFPALGAAAALGLITYAIVRRGRAQPYLAVGWAWYLITLLPVVGLLQVGNQALADRYAYLPLIGIYVAVVWGAGDLIAGRRELRLPLVLAAAFLLAMWGWAARLQVGTWRDSRTLFTHALAVTERNYVAHANLGNVHLRAGEPDRAIEQYRAAIAVRPQMAEAHHNLGIALAETGRHERAVESYRRAIEADPRYVEPYRGLGLSLEALDRPDEALAAYRRALELQPDLDDVRARVAALESRSGR